MVNTTEGGKWVKLETKNDTSEMIPVHLRPGYIIPFQNNTDQTYKTSDEMLSEAFLEILINRDGEGYARGKILGQEGNKKKDIEDGNYYMYNMVLSGKALKKWEIETPSTE